MAVEFKPLPVAGGGTYVPPLVAHANVASTPEDTTLAGSVLADDEVNVGTLSVVKFVVDNAEYMPGAAVSLAGRGTISIALLGAYTFEPAPNVNGACPAVTYWVTNGHELRVATLTITVTPVNDAPIAGSVYGLSLEGEDVVVDLLASSRDPEGDDISVVLVNGSAPSAETPVAITGATITYHADGTVTVNPTSGDPTEITFSFRVQDEHGLTDDGTVTVRVGVDNWPLFSPIAPLVAGVTADDAERNFATSFFQELHPDWPNIGPGGTAVTSPPYSADRGLFALATTREPWLYDRATTAWIYYKRSGLAWARTAALEWAEQYMAAVVEAGGVASFTIDGAAQDVKYIYPAIAWWYELETGSTVYRTKAAALYAGILQYWPTTYEVGPGLWTERGVAFAILGCLAQYAITGDTAALDSATEYVDGVIAISGSGAPLHGHDQHEGDSLTTPITSPWMGAFLAESMLQYYRLTEDARIPTWLSNYGDWLIAHAAYEVEAPDEPEFAGLVGLRLFAYLAGAAGPTDSGQADDVQHARDLQELFRKVRWAKVLLSLSTTAVDLVIEEQSQAAEVDEAYWTRTTVGYPNFRTNPSRKFGWKHRNAYSGGVYHVGLVPLPPILLATVEVTGSTQQGSTLTVTPGTWGGSPTPTLTYQWLRDGANITGETGLTYVTDGDDVDTAVSVRETATNAGGTDSATSNEIDVVLVGTPELTEHPAAASKEVGQTASFSAECTATPTATFQWQSSTNGGSSWSNVSGGTGGSGTANTTTYTTPALAEVDNGRLYRVTFTNVGGSATSNTALLSMVVEQDAVRFAGDSAGAYLAYALGANGHTDLTVEMLVYLEQRNALASILELPGVAGRTTLLQHDNTFGVYEPSIGDSQTGHSGGGWGANPPPLNTWLYMSLRGPATAGGNIVATWTLAEGADSTVYTAQRASGIEGSVPATSVTLNGSGSGANGSGNGLNVRFQFVRGRTGRLSDGQVNADRLSTDVAGWAFWWLFSDNGGGGVAVTDETGNGRVPTLVNATLSTGPVVPSMP